MAADDLIRSHDPFSGHEAPAAADDTSESKKPAEEPAEEPAPPAEPAPKAPTRRAQRRARRTPPPAKTEGVRRRAAKS